MLDQPHETHPAGAGIVHVRAGAPGPNASKRVLRQRDRRLIARGRRRCPDAELLELGRQWAISAEQADRSGAEYAAAERAYVPPPVPEALFERFPGDPLGLTCKVHQPTGRRWYGLPGIIGELRRFRPQLIGATDAARLKVAARLDEIVAAYDGWMAADDAARDACGLTEASAEDERTVEENSELRFRIIETPAATLQGLQLKARVALWCYGGTEEIDAVLDEGHATGHAVIFSIARDLCLMLEAGPQGQAGAAAASPPRFRLARALLALWRASRSLRAARASSIGPAAGRTSTTMRDAERWAAGNGL